MADLVAARRMGAIYQGHGLLPSSMRSSLTEISYIVTHLNGKFSVTVAQKIFKLVHTLVDRIKPSLILSNFLMFSYDFFMFTFSTPKNTSEYT